MIDPLILKSKIQIPAPTRYHIERPRITQRLEQDILSNKLTLLLAPAGYGKSSAIADWARATTTPVAWLSASDTILAPLSLLRHLFASWRAFQPELAGTPLDMVLGSRDPDGTQAATVFLNTAASSSNPLVFVIDDYHHIQDGPAEEALDSLIENSPAPLHWAVASRTLPPLAIARYRGHGVLGEIGSRTLGFTLPEVDQLLRQMGLELNSPQVEALHEATEGWAAALQLAGLSLLRSPQSQVPTPEGSQRFIADYFRQDVFSHLPDQLRTFLLKTSIVARLCEGLCDAITNGDGSQSVLETLEQDGVFTEPLDQQGEWYRYQPLFGDFLRMELERRLSTEEVRGLHSNAARWLANHDFPHQAFRHAVDSLDPALVIEVCERFVPRMLLMGEFATLKAWFDSIPAGWLDNHPILATAKVGYLLQSGALDAAQALLDRIETQLGGNRRLEHQLVRARANAVRCGIACFRNDLEVAETLANKALKELPDDDVFFQSMTYIVLGDTYRKNAQWDLARNNYAQVLRFTDKPLFHQLAVHVYGALADLDMRRGNLKQAAASWEDALAEIDNVVNWGGLPLPLTGWIFIRLAEIQIEWNQLDRAANYVEKGLQRAELGGDVSASIAGHLATARLALVRQDVEAASFQLDKARLLLDQSQLPQWKGQLDRLQVDLWLTKGEQREAEDWANDQWGRVGKDQAPLLSLAVARVLMAAGDKASLDRARGMLHAEEGASRRDGLVGIETEAAALGAVVDWRLGKRAAALAGIDRPLRLAESYGYKRVFIDLGLPMASILLEADHRDALPAYGQELLLGFQDHFGLDPASPVGLPEPLSDREAEVLKLVSTGLTNQETADRLVISPGTVKKHLSNIYGKLGVKSRTAAAARARQLGLIE
jgi:LuxR family maltose regulon positive regulatory protein